VDVQPEEVRRMMSEAGFRHHKTVSFFKESMFPEDTVLDADMSRSEGGSGVDQGHSCMAP